MSVYMGEDGGLMIKRTAVGQGLLRSQLDPGDVNVARKRFSFDFPVEALITGDRIEIFTADGSNLTLVDGHNFPDGLWHCHIDDAGGVRLYDEFEDAINGDNVIGACGQHGEHHYTAKGECSGPRHNVDQLAKLYESDKQGHDKDIDHRPTPHPLRQVIQRG